MQSGRVPSRSQRILLKEKKEERCLVSRNDVFLLNIKCLERCFWDQLEAQPNSPCFAMNAFGQSEI